MAMLGTLENRCERGAFLVKTDRFSRAKLPHGWLVYGGEDDKTPCFVPFAEDGTGWGPNDPAALWGD